jgi:hypothetical protein
MPSPGMLRCVHLVRTDVSEERVAPSSEKNKRAMKSTILYYNISSQLASVASYC